MKIGIAHFTDIHFTEKTNLESKFSSCIDALKNDFVDVKKIYFILSGDIAYSGMKKEYDLAKSYFGRLKMLLELHYKGVAVRFIVVPGNHDCNLIEKNSQIRKNSLTNINYNSIGDDNSVIDICLQSQDEFWEYYSLYNPIPKDKLFFQVCDDLEGFSICFHCINTAWMSDKNEKVGSLFFPVKRYESYNNSNCYLNIGVWHHPYNWITPNTPENNKKEFQRFTERISAVHFLGHEHENEHYQNENINTNDKINLISGKLFNQDHAKNESGFETIILDIPQKVGELKIYDWNKTFYNSNISREISFEKNIRKQFNSSLDYISELNTIKIPLVIGDRKQILLSEIYVFPNLDSFKTDLKILDTYPEAENILKKEYGSCVIVGEEQIGKTSLLNMIYLRKHDEGAFPLLLNGKDIKDLNLDRILKRAYKEQYQNTEETFEAYLQLEKSKKILLIDNYHECTFNAVTGYKLVSEAMQKFDMVVITMDAANSMLPAMQAEFKDINFYSIKSLGYVKRNKLIEKYHYLKENPYSFDEQSFLNTIKESFDNVGSILGDKLMPSYPIFILSILQSLEYKSLKQNETSFAYCYQTLIHYSLHRAGVKNESIDSYFNFLFELAYFFITKDLETISKSGLLKFYADYSDKFITPDYEILITNLRSSKILRFEDDNISFGYAYILYYLSAKRISDSLHSEEGKSVIQKLFKDLHVEKNANILVFVTHHSRDISFIEESLLNSMIILDELTPITLALNDPFYNDIKAIASEITEDIIEINNNPKEEREKQLKRLDETINNSNPSDDVNEQAFEETERIVLPFKKSFRSIEIVGQIIKNRKGSLEKSQLKNMITELYTTGFRTVGYVSEILNSTKEEIKLMLNDDETLESSKAEVEEKINDFFQMSSFQACLNVFGKMMSAMGIRELRGLYNEVAKELNSPAAKVVSFSINSYYGTIIESELKALVNELKNNPVALKIVKLRVKSYVYSKNLDLKTKQKYASILGMQLTGQRPKEK